MTQAALIIALLGVYSDYKLIAYVGIGVALFASFGKSLGTILQPVQFGSGQTVASSAKAFYST